MTISSALDKHLDGVFQDLGLIEDLADFASDICREAQERKEPPPDVTAILLAIRRLSGDAYDRMDVVNLPN